MLTIKMKTARKFVIILFFSICLTTIFMASNSLQVNAASKNNGSVQSFFSHHQEDRLRRLEQTLLYVKIIAPAEQIVHFRIGYCFISYSRVYSGSAPQVTRNNGVHKTSATGTTVRTFSPWTRGDYLWDVSVYPYGNGSYNQTSVTYSKSTTYVSGFSYTVYCSGALVPTLAGSVYTSLKTN